MIEAKIIADSINSSGNRITSFLLKYPRFIHSEFMTHRVLSRNAPSSRAIPINKVIEAVSLTPAEPVSWGKNQSGMQASEALDDSVIAMAKKVWYIARDNAIQSAQALSGLGVHKQIANRLLEPFTHMITLATATEWTNFFALRAHPDAQPEFQELAHCMLEEYLNHEPVKKRVGQWHMVFEEHMPKQIDNFRKLKIATARAARLSYMNFDGKIEPEKDYELHDKLKTSGHWSPFEHCARAIYANETSGNFRGWLQYRKMFNNENITEFDMKGRSNGRKKKNHLGEMEKSI